MASVSIKHIGICCDDIHLSSRFYREALGFEELMPVTEIGAPFDALLELPGAKLEIQQLRCGDATIELLGYTNTAVTGSADRRPMNQLGLTHITLAVSDVDAVANRISELGGTAHPETLVDSPFGRILFCSDPNGVRIELMQAPE